MAISAPLPLVHAWRRPLSKPWLVWAIALAGCAAGRVVRLRADERRDRGELGEPLVIAALWTWTTLAYILGGLLAWWRRRRAASAR